MIDPTGEILPILVGIGIGAGLELGIQLLENDGNFDCVNWWTVAFWGGVGGLGGFLNGSRLLSNTGRLLFKKNNYGIKRLFYDNSAFGNVSKQYWNQSLGGATRAGNQLSHVFFRNESKWVPQGFRNAGFNLIELPKHINALGGTAGRSLNRVRFNDAIIRVGLIVVIGHSSVQGGRLGNALFGD